ncbi:PAS domain-containing sensor histidine kinase [uncultured Sphingomonas sp.]|uniref:hybrid sensor histidine kinase/response regulator n=1 Tax=uncultured Sphingomonas sp. TaxID=158754 RepID=UPI0025F12EFE|nr:PAS domain S-box protein [uncultured Sphingomonas sp.]
MHDVEGAGGPLGSAGLAVTAAPAPVSPVRLGEAHFRDIVESASDLAIFTTDVAGQVTSWSSGAERLLGWSETEALGRHACMIFTPEHLAHHACEEEMRTAAASGRSEDERWHRRKDGSEFWACGLMMRFEDDATGEHIGFLKVLRDGTAQHEAEERKHESEQLAHALFESSADCVKLIDLEGRLHAMNGPGMCLMEIDDFTPFAGQEWASLWPEELRPEVRRAAEEAKAGGTGRFCGYCPTAKGTSKWWDVQVSPVAGADGSPSMLLSVSRDVTKREEGQQALGESEARFRNMADHAPVMMWVTDPSGACTYLNKRWYEFTGQSEVEAEGFGWLDATHPDDRAEAERAFLQANASQAPFRFEYRLRHAEDGYRWAIDAASPRFDDDGSFLGYIGSVIDIDERRRAELAVQESNALLAAVMEAVPGVVYAKDDQGRMLAANRGTSELVGKPPGEILGRTDAEFLDDPAQADAVMANDQRIMAENRAEVLEEQVSLPDGTHATWLSTKAPFRDPSGKVVGLVGSSLDITERKQAEQQLRESEARLRALTDNLPSGMVYQIRTGPDGTGRRFLYVSQSHEKLTGIAAEAVLADPTIAYTLILPEYRPAMIEAEREAIRDCKPFDIQARFRRADGEVRWCRIISAPRTQSDGSLIWDGIQIDITDQKKAEELLRELNETLEADVAERTAERDRVWGTSRDLLVVIDRAGAFHAVNPAWTKILGWSEDELLGRPVFDFVHPDDVALTIEALANANAGQSPSVEHRYRRKDGSYRSISWVAAPEGEYIYANGRDVTSERERTAELERTQEQLRQSQKMEAVGQLTGGIAHDFNNLLTGVIGSLDMMQRRIAKGETDKIERYATTAMTAANRAAALTHRLLAFARRQPLDPKPVNANRLVTGMEELLRRTIGETVSLEIVTAGGLWQTLCDPNQLESAILNLAINARDALPAGGKLTIETCNARLDGAYAARQRDVRPGQYVCICVTDTGTGMTPEVIAKAFDPFFTTKPIGQGTGLGLSMIYGFTRQSEGYARIYSEVGQGTTIKLYLPRYYGESEELDSDRAELTEAHRSDDGEVVLVVEDEVAVRDLVIDVLQDLGYKAIEAADGPAGLKILQSDLKLDLLISDVGLPGLNGRQLADAARKHRPDLKVLFMTGYAENATIASGFLDPGMQMITKPFAIEALATRIRDMIEQA